MTPGDCLPSSISAELVTCTPDWLEYARSADGTDCGGMSKGVTDDRSAAAMPGRMPARIDSAIVMQSRWNALTVMRAEWQFFVIAPPYSRLARRLLRSYDEEVVC